MSRASAAGENGDVQGFESGDGGRRASEPMSLERTRQLNDVMHMGNEALRQHQLEQAIEFYSRADKIKENDAMILTRRCSAYLMLSHFLLRRHPSAAEDRPFKGLDPQSYAEFALKDAEKVRSLQRNSVLPYILQAKALFLLERYDAARAVIRSGLQIDPQSTDLMNLERTIPSTLIRRNPHSDEYDCSICMKLLYEPVTTPCGHSFCRSCLFQSMDRGNKCPLCRTVMFLSPNTSFISITLNNIIQTIFPEKYAERKSESENVTNLRADLLPLFVKGITLPCQKFPLKISEPSYRLMVRRIMEGNRLMGMAVKGSSANSVEEYACEVEITNCEPLPDGSFFLEVESRRRCRILRHWAQDGYRVAEVEWMQDDLPPEGTEERNILLERTDMIADFACEWLDWAKTAPQYETQLDEIYEAEGLMPPRTDPEPFSFWLCTLTEKILPSDRRLDLLRTTNTTERLTKGLFYLMLTDPSMWNQLRD